MYDRLRASLATLEPSTLVSGGAAFADHLAVRAFLRGDAGRLDLHLPARLGDDGFEGHPDARTANVYHARFSEALGIDSLDEIERALRAGATATVHPGYAARNAHVATSDAVMAFTAGGRGRDTTGATAAEAGLKGGGTAKTWDMARTPHKVHVDLSALARRAGAVAT